MEAPTTNSIGGSKNLVVLIGRITSEPTLRQLATGVDVIQFDLATLVEDAGKAANISVPVVAHDASSNERKAIVDGAHVVVIGTVRRRFFRAGGLTQSRTEVVVSRLIPASRSKTARSAVASVANELSRSL